MLQRSNVNFSSFFFQTKALQEKLIKIIKKSELILFKLKIEDKILIFNKIERLKIYLSQ